MATGFLGCTGPRTLRAFGKSVFTPRHKPKGTRSKDSSSQHTEAAQVPANAWPDTHPQSTHTVERHTALKRKAILTPAATWMGLGDTVLSDIARHRRTDVVSIHLHEGPKIAEFTETESGWWAPGAGREGASVWWDRGQRCRVTSSVGGHSDGRTAVGMCWVPLRLKMINTARPSHVFPHSKSALFDLEQPPKSPRGRDQPGSCLTMTIKGCAGLGDQGNNGHRAPTARPHTGRRAAVTGV